MFRKKILFGRIIPPFFCKSSESGRFSFIYMIRIRFFGLGALIQNYFRAAQYVMHSGSMLQREMFLEQRKDLISVKATAQPRMFISSNLAFVTLSDTIPFKIITYLFFSEGPITDLVIITGHRFFPWHSCGIRQKLLEPFFFSWSAVSELGKKNWKLVVAWTLGLVPQCTFRNYAFPIKKDVDSCRFLSVLSCKHGWRRSGKVRRRPRQWHVQGRFSMTRVWPSTSLPTIVQSWRRNNCTQRMGSTELSRSKRCCWFRCRGRQGFPHWQCTQNEPLLGRAEASKIPADVGADRLTALSWLVYGRLLRFSSRSSPVPSHALCVGSNDQCDGNQCCPCFDGRVCG